MSPHQDNSGDQVDESFVLGGPHEAQLTKEELVDQIQDSELNDSGPNEQLRRHIENFSQYGPLLRSLGHTILGGAILPLLIGYVAYQFNSVSDLGGSLGALARAMRLLCLPLFVGICLGRALRTNGIAEKYFRWSPTLCKGLLQTVNVIVWVWLPLRFLYTSLETFDDCQWDSSLGRFLFIVAMVAATYGFWRTSRQLGVWLHESDDNPLRRQGSYIVDLLVWFLPILPAWLAIMSAAGYHFTAVQMSWRGLWTFLLIVGIAVVGGFISRLLLIAQFSIKLRQLRRDDAGEINSDESIDIGAISKQVNRLLRATSLVAMVVVAWQIWGNVLPVFGYLDDWHVYKTSLADGLTHWITLRHLLLATGIVILTFILSNNLPGLLEITLLDRLPLDRGGRYAISFVVKYLVAIVGLFIACQTIGFSWAKVQWLAAGLTVGLGFGLQEIFANVISGLIILIERPIRVGDVVTVANTTGTVTRMQLRATTVMDRDYRELIVPNKKFITENVMNWTLTDLTSRVILKIGVAYGSDTQLVQDTLMKVAKRHPLINETPAPEVVFESFGDSTLNFELRVFIPNREVYAQVLHELNMSIDAAFAEKNIEIAFPQRDIHIRNLNEFPAPQRGPGGRSPRDSNPNYGPAGSTGGPGDAPDVGVEGSRPESPMVASHRPSQYQGETWAVDNPEPYSAPLGMEPRPTDSPNNSPNDLRTKRRVIPFPLRQVRGNNEVSGEGIHRAS